VHLKNVSVLIPFKPDYGPRDRAFKWVQKFYERFLPEVQICIGECESELFSRSEAINKASKKATGDIFVIADSDLFYNPEIIHQSIKILERFAWVVPYHKVHYIDEESTKRVLGSEPEWPVKMNLDTWTLNATKNITVGGLNILPKKNFEMVRGFDERFRGWGGEDEGFESAVNTLCGHYVRIDTDIFHLWHPRLTGNPQYGENLALHGRYRAAEGNKEAMEKLIRERG
jgi:hypothetical protein